MRRSGCCSPASATWSCWSGHRDRRHLAGQHLPGLRVRRTVGPLLVLVRAQPGLDPVVLPPAGDLGLPARLRRPVRPGAVPAARRRAAAGDAGTTPRSRWRIRTSAGELTADVLVAATGPLCEPRIPRPPGPGLDFAGTVFHSARWRHDHDLTGRDVAVVGTGASAIQFVPQIAPQVRRLTVFQRTAPWVIAAAERPGEPARRTRPTAGSRCVQRIARTAVYAALESLVFALLHPRVARHAAAGRRAQPAGARSTDPALRAAPDPGLHVGLQADPLLRRLPAGAAAGQRPAGDRRPSSGCCRTPSSVPTGSSTQVDTIILGTGFHVTDQPIADRIVGRDGPHAGRALAGQPAGLRHRDRARLPQPVPRCSGPTAGSGTTRS